MNGMARQANFEVTGAWETASFHGIMAMLHRACASYILKGVHENPEHMGF
jgi:hypothetical protein